MAKRLSDTAALVGGGTGESDYSRRSVEVEKIDNGYLVTKSTSGDGEYTCTKEYSRDRPNLDGGQRSEAQSGSGSLRDAIKTAKEG